MQDVKVTESGNNNNDNNDIDMYRFGTIFEKIELLERTKAVESSDKKTPSTVSENTTKNNTTIAPNEDEDDDIGIEYKQQAEMTCGKTAMKYVDYFDGTDPSIKKAIKALELLGKGSYGSVYRYEGGNLPFNTITDLEKKQYAIKETKISLHEEDLVNIDESKPFNEAMSRESIVEASLLHTLKFGVTPICKLLFDVQNNKQYTFMKIGKTASIFEVNEGTAIPFIKSVLTNLFYIHETDVSHGDIKATNILVFDSDQNVQKQQKKQQQQQRMTTAFIDFGFASTKWIHQTKQNNYMYTSGYKAPELLINYTKHLNLEGGKKADVWAMGVFILNKLLTPKIYIKNTRVAYPMDEKIPTVVPPKKKTEEEKQIDMLSWILWFTGDMFLPNEGSQRYLTNLISSDIYKSAIDLTRVLNKRQEINMKFDSALNGRLNELGIENEAQEKIKKLLKSMLKIDPAERCTARQALEMVISKEEDGPVDILPEYMTGFTRNPRKEEYNEDVTKIMNNVYEKLRINMVGLFANAVEEVPYGRSSLQGLMRLEFGLCNAYLELSRNMNDKVKRTNYNRDMQLASVEISNYGMASMMLYDTLHVGVKSESFINKRMYLDAFSDSEFDSVKLTKCLVEIVNADDYNINIPTIGMMVFEELTQDLQKRNPYERVEMNSIMKSLEILQNIMKGMIMSIACYSDPKLRTQSFENNKTVIVSLITDKTYDAASETSSLILKATEEILKRMI
jgi:serine/threonine protein kinase